MIHQDWAPTSEIDLVKMTPRERQGLRGYWATISSNGMRGIISNILEIEGEVYVSMFSPRSRDFLTTDAINVEVDWDSIRSWDRNGDPIRLEF